MMSNACSVRPTVIVISEPSDETDSGRKISCVRVYSGGGSGDVASTAVVDDDDAEVEVVVDDVARERRGARRRRGADADATEDAPVALCASVVASREARSAARRRKEAGIVAVGGARAGCV